MSRSRLSRKASSFTESVIREMTRLANRHQAVNLSQGFPDFPAPEAIKRAACEAILADVNQYAVTWGAKPLRDAIAADFTARYGVPVVPDEQITVCCGSTECMVATQLALVDPGEEVIIFEPFYENYGPDAILSDARPVFLPLEAPEYRLDPDRLRSLVTDRTRAIVLNTPNNPTGRVFDAEEMEAVAEICRSRGILAVTDEIYEHILYEGRHVPLATLDGMRERTITISGVSKTFSVTGWRIGTILAPPELTGAIRKVHDFLTVGAPAPLQEACAVGMDELDESYYTGMISDYRERREILVDALREAGFRCNSPQGAYYVLADFSQLSDEDDQTFAKRLTRDGGVASVPGSSFFSLPERGRSLVRFAFCKRAETLREAGQRLVAFPR